MSSARDIIEVAFATDRRLKIGSPALMADTAIDVLTAAGYRILPEGELDAVTIERCAQYHDALAEQWRPVMSGISHAHDAHAAALRALQADRGEK